MITKVLYFFFVPLNLPKGTLFNRMNTGGVINLRSYQVRWPVRNARSSCLRQAVHLLWRNSAKSVHVLRGNCSGGKPSIYLTRLENPIQSSNMHL